MGFESGEGIDKSTKSTSEILREVTEQGAATILEAYGRYQEIIDSKGITPLFNSRFVGELGKSDPDSQTRRRFNSLTGRSLRVKTESVITGAVEELKREDNDPLKYWLLNRSNYPSVRRERSQLFKNVTDYRNEMGKARGPKRARESKTYLFDAIKRLKETACRENSFDALVDFFYRVDNDGNPELKGASEAASKSQKISEYLGEILHKSAEVILLASGNNRLRVEQHFGFGKPDLYYFDQENKPVILEIKSNSQSISTDKAVEKYGQNISYLDHRKNFNSSNGTEPAGKIIFLYLYGPKLRDRTQEVNGKKINIEYHSFLACLKLLEQDNPKLLKFLRGGDNGSMRSIDQLMGEGQAKKMLGDYREALEFIKSVFEHNSIGKITLDEAVQDFSSILGNLSEERDLLKKLLGQS